MNSAEGKERRGRNSGKNAIVHTSEATRSTTTGKFVNARCLFCDNRTSQACKQCSTAEVKFWMCTTPSLSSNGSRCPKTCFQRCHDADKITPDYSRKKITSQREFEANMLNVDSARKKKRSRAGSEEHEMDAFADLMNGFMEI